LAQARRQAAAAGAETGLAQERLEDLAGTAPLAGTIQQIFRRQGEVVAAGQPIASLLTPENMKVRFFAPEAMLARLPVGARVIVSCDGCAQPVEARVSFVATEPQFTPPVIYSLDQREKLVFLVEARFDGATPIRPGMPVDLRIAE
jgi:HlyD family secretion protein